MDSGIVRINPKREIIGKPEHAAQKNGLHDSIITVHNLPAKILDQANQARYHLFARFHPQSQGFNRV